MVALTEARRLPLDPPLRIPVAALGLGMHSRMFRANEKLRGAVAYARYADRWMDLDTRYTRHGKGSPSLMRFRNWNERIDQR